MDTDIKWVITEEERTRHEALFYSQSPKKGYLSGEQARSLFIRSRLPLSELSKIWKLADISRDNLLDVSEFAVAMHLIQLKLKGFEIPEKLPTTLTPVRPKLTVVAPMTTEEWNAYNKTFVWKDTNNSGLLDTETSCGIMLMSSLDSSVLSKIWNLSDTDRDAKLSLEEFAVAFHLLRFCKKGNELEGSVDARAMLPIEALKDDGEAKKKRHAEVQTERRKLLTLKQKICSELAHGLDDSSVNEKIRPELNKVEDRLSALEKEETELRRSLLNLKDRSKKDNFEPFDKSFIQRKRLSGQDLFKGGDKKRSIDKDNVLFERLWTLNGTNLENTVPSKESNGITPPQISLSNNYSETQPSDITFKEVTRSSGTAKSTNAPRILNGVSEDNKTRSAENNQLVQDSNEISNRLQSTEKSKEPTSRARSSRPAYENKDDLDSKKKVVDEKVEEKLLTKPRKVVERDESFSWARIGKRPIITKRVQEEVLDIPPDKKKQEKGNNSKGNKPVQEEVSSGSVENLESAADQNINKMFEQMSVDLENGAVNGIAYEGSHSGNSRGYKLPVGRVISFEEEKQLIETGAFKKAERQVPSKKNPTQEELLPIYLEEKKKVEEERRKKKEIEEVKSKQAREDLKKQEEERRRELMGRKGAMQVAKGKMEKHLSQSDNDVYRPDTGYLIERDFEEQRIREEEAQKRIEEVRKNEMMYPKGKDQKSGAKQVYIDTGKAPDSKPQSVIRRPKTEPKQYSNRKSWVELEIEEQKRKDDEMRREIEQRQSDLERLANDQKPLNAIIKKEMEITESSIKSTTTHRTVESQPPASYTGTRGTHNSDVNRANNNAQRRVNIPDRNTNGPRVQGNAQVDNIPIDIVDGKVSFQERQNERKFLDEEERRRKEQIELIRKESNKREAEELMRQKTIRDEEMRQKKEIALWEAKKRNQEEENRLAEAQKVAESRRLTFFTQKVRLEERVINTMKESVESNKGTRAQNDEQNVSSSQPLNTRERKTSVQDKKALFEKSAPNQEQAKVVMRQKRQSLNLEDSGNQQKPSRKDRASFYSDGTTTQECQMPITRERGSRVIERDDQPAPTRLNLGNISEKRQQFEGQRQQNPVERRQPPTKERAAPSESKSPPPLDQQDASKQDASRQDASKQYASRQDASRQDASRQDASRQDASRQDASRQDASRQDASRQDALQPMTSSFFPISNSKIQKEMAELRDREQEIHVRRQAMGRVPSSDKESLDAVKRNPLPNKMQIQRGSSTTSDVVVRRTEPEQKSAPNRQPANRKSFIEIEKEKEREREEELQREREAVMREVEVQKKKKEEQLETNLKIQEEKEMNKNPPNAMNSRWGKRGQFY